MLFAQTYFQWQTTHDGIMNSAECRLLSDKIIVTVFPFHLDVEEEAVLSPTGTVWTGDPKTLELSGTFTLSEGSALRSMLLWEKDKILKAKLIDRIAADSTYEAIVDRDKPVILARDPAEITCIGNNTYNYRIYPVELNGSRKIRILYSVPFVMSAFGPVFKIKTAFAIGASQTPSQVPVEVRKSSTISGSYLLFYGSVKKSIQFGATYEISKESLFADSIDQWGNDYGLRINPIIIFPESGYSEAAFTTTLDSGNAAGNYTAVFAELPDTIRAALRELPENQSYTIEAQVIAGEKTYLADFNAQKGYLGVYMKSKTAWDSTVYWRVYDASGNSALACKKSYKPQSGPFCSQMLPLMWAAKYSLVEGSGNLGALFGFVDSRMSLLARESDTLNALERSVWGESGVPLLTSGDILVNSNQLPTPPRDMAIFEYGTGTKTLNTRNKVMFTICIKDRGHISIQLSNPDAGPVKAMLFDLSGRLLQTWGNVRCATGAIDLHIPSTAKGCLVLRVCAGREIMQKKFMIGR
jgi:hypothetical protein